MVIHLAAMYRNKVISSEDLQMFTSDGIKQNEVLEVWEDTDIAKEIKACKTLGRTLAIYRDRSGLTLVQLAEKLGTKYTNISAMENDRRPIGLRMAKKLGKVLNVDYTKFLR